MTTAPIGLSPETFPHQLNPDANTQLIVELSEQKYQEASFLDDRLREPGKLERSAPWPDMAAASTRLSSDRYCHWIYHIGHVGSTLLSRILGEHPALFSLREPIVLRQIAQSVIEGGPECRMGMLGSAADVLEVQCRLLARTFRSEQTSLVKATSFASVLAPVILRREPRARAILLIAAPQVYLATILGAENNPRELLALAPLRWRRMQAMAPALQGERLDALGPGELCAMSWAVEMAILGLTAQAHPTQCLGLDFDRFLHDPRASLAACLAHLGCASDAPTLNALMSSQHWGRYAKAPDHAFDPAMRQHLIAQTWSQQRPVLQAGMTWLDRTLRANPALARALAPFMA
ncbi:MAG TPA: hypothetical protein DCL54_00685 [Alphaproteobacteria bacterium]|nr:hypothetical protein [Alphaproteobacteria bacterium]HAJ45081.1 hypothetical protein [Alphaproteobacteria bacterium]